MKENNMNNWFFDKNFTGVSDDFFEDAITYLDFPLEDFEPNDVSEDWAAKLQQLEPPPNVFQCFSSGLYGGNCNEKMKNNSSVSYVGYSLLKEQPSIGGASSSRSGSLHFGSSECKCLHLFRTSSPVSVLESRSSSSCCTENLECKCKTVFIQVKRPRSKRARLQRRIFPFITASSASPKLHPYATSDPETESYLDEIAAKKKQKKKNIKPFSQSPVETRKCSHCEVTKTPQWREGPQGPKTLCNACGVRYRSGRLLPEYRPAASPTFVPTMHSNSHKKVLEMRKQTVSTREASDSMVL